MENRQSSSAIRANKWKAKLKRNTGASERGPPAEPRLKEWSRDRLESGWLAHTQTRLAGLYVGAF
jgi:hypothetical protein